MEPAAVFRSFNYSLCCKANLGFPSVSYIGGFAACSKFFPYGKNRKDVLVSCVKGSDGVAGIANSDGNSSQASGQNNALGRATFPSGFEALLLEVCDETEIAEMKVKVGDFEMLVKRNIGAATGDPLSGISPTIPPPVPSEPMNESAPAPPAPSPPKSSPEKSASSKYPQLEKSSKIAALEASGASGFVLVSSPAVGSFRRGRTVKEKKLPPICKQGDVIKEGQVVGFIDQFGSVLPIKSNVAGEVLKVLCEDGEPVGYGDPIIAVLPSFHDINLK